MWKKRLKRGIRILLCLFCLGTAGYALLPSCLPTGMVRSRLIAQLERDFQRRVQIGRIHISWSQGVRIEDLVIQRKAKFGPGPLLQIDRVHTAFRPWMLLRQGLQTVYLEDVTLYVVATEKELNVIDLPPLEMSRLEVDRATVHFESRLNGLATESVFSVGAAVFLQDQRYGGTRWQLQATQQGQTGPTLVSGGQIGDFRVPDAGFGGANRQNLTLNVQELDLRPLRLDRWLNLALDRSERPAGEPLPVCTALGGVCSAALQLENVDEGDLQISGDFKTSNVQVQLLSPRWEAPRTFEPADWSGQIELAVDPIGPAIRCPRFRLEGPGLLIAGQGLYDARPDALTGVSLTIEQGRLEPNQWIACLPADLVEPYRDALGSGPIEFQCQYDAAGPQEVGRIQLDGDRWRFRTPQVQKDSPEPLRLEARWTFHRPRGQLEINPIHLRWGTLESRSELVLADAGNLAGLIRDGRWAQLCRSLLDDLGQPSGQASWQTAVRIERLDQWRRHFPALAPLEDDWISQGPLEIHGQCLNTAEEPNQIRLTVDLPSEARWQWLQDGKIRFNKPPGQTLHCELSGRRRAGWDIDALRIRARYDQAEIIFGPGRLVSANPIPIAAADHPQLADGPGDPSALQDWYDLSGRYRDLTVQELGGDWQVTRLEEWLALLPEIRADLQQEGIDLEGACRGRIDYRHEPGQSWDGSCQLQLRDLAIRAIEARTESARKNAAASTTVLWQKPAGTPAACRLQLTEAEPNGLVAYRLRAELPDLQVQADGQAVRLATAADSLGPLRQRQWQFDAHVSDWATLRRYLLPDRDWVATVGDSRLCFDRLAGGGHFAGILQIGELSESLTFSLQADDSSARVQLFEAGGGVRPLWQKSAGTPLRLDGKIELAMKNDWLGIFWDDGQSESSGRRLRWNEISLRTDGLTGTFSGYLDYEIPPEDFGPALGNRYLKLFGRQRFRLDHDRLDGNSWPFWQEMRQGQEKLEQLDLSGVTDIQTEWTWDAGRRQWSASAWADLTATDIRAACRFDPNDPEPFRWEKPAAESLRLEAAGRVGFSSDSWDLDQCRILFGSNTVSVSGRFRPQESTAAGDSLDLDPVAEPWIPPAVSLRPERLEVSLRAPDISGPANWFPALSGLDVQGNLDADVQIFRPHPSDPLRWEPSRVQGRIAAVWQDYPLALEIRDWKFADNHLILPEAYFQVGQNQVSLVADLEHPILTLQGWKEASSHPAGRLDLISQRVDMDDIQRFLETLPDPSARTGSPPGTLPAGSSAETSAETSCGSFQSWLTGLQSSRLHGVCLFQELGYTDPASGVRMDLEKLGGSYALAAGQLDLEFTAGLGGGAVEGSFRMDIRGPDPQIEYHQQAREIQARPMLRGLVESEFPGLEVTGSISETKKLSGSLCQILHSGFGWQGTGTTQCQQGILYGPGGPGWVLRVFPGLQLVKYAWREFTNEYTLAPDGTKKNTMLFKGSPIDIYVDGDSRPVRDEGEYRTLMETLQKDLEISRRKLGDLVASGADDTTGEAGYIRRRTEGLEQLWRRHQAGQTLRAARANYTVGGLISTKRREDFAKPTEILRIPIFQTRSYIVDRQMVGIETSNVPFNPLGL
ncbi:MAG: hypothetical protein JW810_01615 [Sedimentisphaerales bacterium]|nr:hypothetical protein [Sedimentisphaerales bacterium]